MKHSIASTNVVLNNYELELHLFFMQTPLKITLFFASIK